MRRVCSWVRLPFRRVLKLRSRDLRKGSLRWKSTGWRGWRRARRRWCRGWGRWRWQLAGLAAEAGRAVTLDAMEVLVTEQGRKLLCGLVQLALDGQAEGEVRLPQVTGSDGVRRTRAGRGHARTVVTRLGAVMVRRIGYRSGIKGAGRCSRVMRCWACRRAGIPGRCSGWRRCSCRSGSYEQAHEFVLAVTGVSVGRRQLEQITMAAAADAERFCQDRERAAVSLAGLRGGAGGAGEGPAAAGDLGGRQGGVDAAGGPPPRDGPQGRQPAGAGVRQAAGHRAEVRLQADRRDRRGLRRPAAGGAQDPGAGHGPGPRPGRPRGPPRR